MGELTRLIADGRTMAGCRSMRSGPPPYAELKLLAHQPPIPARPVDAARHTSLVNESYLSVAGIQNAPHRRIASASFAYASRVMRSVIVDLVRERCRSGAAAAPSTRTDVHYCRSGRTDEPLRVHDALFARARDGRSRLGQV